MAPAKQLTDTQWLRIFREARELGVGFILLAGGEPMVREDVNRAAGNVPEILFPIFTNGTIIDDSYIDLLDRCRNLVPVFSIEGGRETTDQRRGAGVYDRLIFAMERMREKRLLLGASVTVTRENLREVASRYFADDLQNTGCRAIVYMEYVPVDASSQALVPQDAERTYLDDRLRSLRAECGDMLFVSFPGDEKSSGGCLAAGRVFLHINSHGGA